MLLHSSRMATSRLNCSCRPRLHSRSYVRRLGFLKNGSTILSHAFSMRIRLFYLIRLFKITRYLITNNENLTTGVLEFQNLLNRKPLRLLSAMLA